MTDIKKIEEGLKFLDGYLASTRRFHGIEAGPQTLGQSRRWWKFWRSDPPSPPSPPALIDLYDRLYHKFEAHLTGLCSELLPVFKVFVHNDGICINGKPGEVGWLKIEHSLQYSAEAHVLTVYFAAHKVYTYGEHHINGLPCAKDKMKLHNKPDILLKLVAMWPEFQSGIDVWLADLRETNQRKIDDANRALASLGV